MVMITKTALVEHLISEHFVGADAPLLNESLDGLAHWHDLDHKTGVYKHVPQDDESTPVTDTAEFLYTHGDCAYDDVCGCESLKGLPRWQYHLLALPITRTTAKRIYYRFPEDHWRDDDIEHYVDRAKFAGTRKHDRPGEAWVKTSGTTGYHLFLTPDKPEWFYDHADEVWPDDE